MQRLNADKNLVLVGMPGVGKSTVGILLAKALSRRFLDTDVMIQAQEGRRLQEIIDADGIEAFCAIEERHVLSVDCRGWVIATGGSVVYSARAMDHLRASGMVAHLSLPFADLERRVNNLDSRGVVMTRHQSLRQLFKERMPLYGQYADCTVECAGLAHEEVVSAVVAAVAEPAE